ncbi:hypothetical protein VTL71DRAFT_10988 [Oculimacula yallundae]|uniref:Uncharacterized protein n=1 Tax=Oculimacula yallundae TaxID=86028 RepID=A0ABR4CV26_9HELO
MYIPDCTAWYASAQWAKFGTGVRENGVNTKMAHAWYISRRSLRIDLFFSALPINRFGVSHTEFGEGGLEWYQSIVDRCLAWRAS